MPWWRAFTDAPAGWWQSAPRTGEVADDVNRRLGRPTPVKRWLVRLYLSKLRLYERHTDEGLAKLVLPSRSPRPGAQGR